MLQVPGPEVVANTVQDASTAGTCRVLVQVPGLEVVAYIVRWAFMAGTCGFGKLLKSEFCKTAAAKPGHI